MELHRSKESGRTILELIAVLVIMLILTLGGLYIYERVMAKMGAKDLVDEIAAMATKNRLELTHSDRVSRKTTKRDGRGTLTSEPKNNGKDFSITVEPESELVCDELTRTDLLANAGVSRKDVHCPESVTFYFNGDFEEDIWVEDGSSGGHGGGRGRRRSEDDRCPDEHALECDERGDSTLCESGYYVYNKVCVECPEHCVCDGKIILGAEKGYYKEGRVCKECGPNVLRCNGEKPLSCVDNYYLKDGECLKCPDNSTTTEYSQQSVPGTGCYCKAGHRLNTAKTGCEEGCDTSSDCPTEQPVCYEEKKDCDKCESNYGGTLHSCPTEKMPLCDEGRCRFCPGNTVWNATQKMCKECSETDLSQCPTDKPYCKNDEGTCVECLENIHCGDGRYCTTDKICADCDTNILEKCSIDADVRDETTNCLKERKITCEGDTPYCDEEKEECEAILCPEDYEVWNGKCVVKCEGPTLSGERDEEGNCLCSLESIACCPKGYYHNTDGGASCVCSACPKFDTSGWENYCDTQCEFTPEDPKGCCRMVVVDGMENCSDGSKALTSLWLPLGKLDGQYRVTYISGGIKLQRFQNTVYHWYVPPFNFIQQGGGIQLLPASTTTFQTVSQLEKSDAGKSVTVTAANANYYLYMGDGEWWTHPYCGSGVGCSDNCGQVKYLFEKISGCPEHSSTTVTSWQIGTTGCYCEEGYIPNEAGDGCMQGCQSYKDCQSGEFCDMTGNITSCLEKPTAGICRGAKKKRIFDGYDFYTYDGVTSRGKYNTTGGMDWWSAMDFCAAIGEPAVSYKDYCASSDTGSHGACVGYRGIGDCPAFLVGSNSNDYWLSDLVESNKCYAYDLTFGADLCAGNGTDKTKDYDNDSPRYALCGTGPNKVCNSNADCSEGNYCHIETTPTNSVCGATSGTCKPVKDKKTFSFNGYQFITTSERMPVVAADNWCTAVGYNTASLADLDLKAPKGSCSRGTANCCINTQCLTTSGTAFDWGNLRNAENTIGTGEWNFWHTDISPKYGNSCIRFGHNSSHSAEGRTDSNLFGIGDDPYLNHPLCRGEKVSGTCATNADCGEGEYCHLDPDPTRSSNEIYNVCFAGPGVCQPIGEKKTFNFNGYTFTTSMEAMPAVSTYNWCQALGLKNTSASELDMELPGFSCSPGGVDYCCYAISGGALCSEKTRTSIIAFSEAVASVGGTTWNFPFTDKNPKNSCRFFILNPTLTGEGMGYSGGGIGTGPIRGTWGTSVAHSLCHGERIICPANSSSTVREGAQIGTTGCYCDEGYGIDENGNCVPAVGEGADCSKSPCEKGLFCNRINNGWDISIDDSSCSNPAWHNCYPAGKGIEVTYKGKKYLVPTKDDLKKTPLKNLSYWSAKDWCAAHGRHLVTLAELGITSNGSNGWNGVDWDELQVFFAGLKEERVDLFVVDTPDYCHAYSINNTVKGVSKSAQRNQDDYMWWDGGGAAGTYSSGCICK